LKDLIERMHEERSHTHTSALDLTCLYPVDPVRRSLESTMVKGGSYRIKNACKRREVHAKVKAEKKKAKKTARAKREREAEELGSEAPPKQVRVLLVMVV